MSSLPEEIHADARKSWQTRPTLPGGVYHLREVWAEEKERIFASEWIFVGREEEIANRGDFMVREVAEESVLLTRARNGEVRAFFNVCTHRGTRLCDGSGSAKSGVFKCPYHAWTFDTDGNLVGTPNVHENEGFDRSTRPLWRVAIDTWEGFLFVNLTSSHEPEPLPSFLARNVEDDPAVSGMTRWGLENLRIGYRIDYEVAANWKILVDNYSECLHCPSVHPELVRLVPLFRKGLVEHGDGAELADGATTLTPTGGSTRPPLPGLEPQDLHVYLGNVIYPTMMVNLHSDCVMTYRLEPRGPEHTTVVSEFLFHPDTIAREDFDPSDIAGFWDLVSRQDWGVCEREQLGVRSRAYASGGVHPYNDHSILEFNDRYRVSMGDG